MKHLTLLLPLLAGCPYIAPVVKPSEWDCGIGQCEVTVTIDVAGLVSCYGTSDNLPPDLAGCGTAMDNSDPECVLGWEGLTFEGVVVTPDMCCEGSEDLAEACCEAGEWDLTASGQSELDSIITGDCDIDYVLLPDEVCQVDFEFVDPVGECNFEKISPTGYVDAEYMMEINHEHSYVVVDLGSETVSSSLQGWALVASGPKRVLVAVAGGDDFQAQGYSYTDNEVFVAAEILLYGTSGVYSVPTNQTFDIRVSSLRNGTDYGFGLEPTISSGGTFDVPNATWTYDYYESSSGQSIEVHLEGELLVVSY